MLLQTKALSSRVRQAGSKVLPPNDRLSRGRPVRSRETPKRAHLPPPEDPPQLRPVTPQEQNLRWQHLSRTLWVMLVVDEKPNTDNGGLNSILDILVWRIQSQISEEEFVGLYKSWMAHEGNKGIQASLQRGPSAARLGSFRQMLIMRGHRETDLDLMLALMINEQNREFSQSSNGNQNFGAPMGLRGVAGALCTPQWLSLSEKAFFLVDSRGYGHLTFDELQYFVFATSYARGDLKNLNMANLAAATLELLDCALLGEHPAQMQHLRSERPMEFDMITLPMFKRYLVHFACGEGVVAKTLEALQVVADAYQKKGIHLTGQKLDVSSLPRIWEQAVQEQIGSSFFANTNDAVAPLVNFLLVDAPTAFSRRWLQGHASLDAAASDLWRALQQIIDGAQGTSSVMIRDPTYQLILRILSKYTELRSQLFQDLIACLGVNPAPCPPSQLLPISEITGSIPNDPMRAWTEAQQKIAQTVQMDTPFMQMQMLHGSDSSTPGQHVNPSGYTSDLLSVPLKGNNRTIGNLSEDSNIPLLMQENSAAAANSVEHHQHFASQHAMLSVPDTVISTPIDSTFAFDLTQMVEGAVWEDIITVPENFDKITLPWNSGESLILSPRKESDIVRLVDLLITAEGAERETILQQLKQMREGKVTADESHTQTQVPQNKYESKSVRLLS